MLADNCSLCDRLNDYVGGQLFCLRTVNLFAADD